MWTQVENTTDRWTWQDESEIWRHQLLHGNGTFIELHGQFLHRYSDQGQTIDPEWPLNNAWHESTEVVADSVDSDEEGWQVCQTALNE